MRVKYTDGRQRERSKVDVAASEVTTASHMGGIIRQQQVFK